MNSKKGFELSINMIVIIVLGVSLMIVGITIFYNSYIDVINIKSHVDYEILSELNNLMNDDDALLAIPFSKRDGERGKFVDFYLGIDNELGVTSKFITCINYSGSSADFEGNINPFEENVDWLLISSISQKQTLLSNERGFVPIRIVVPKKGLLKGEYVFDIVVKSSVAEIDDWYSLSVDQICSEDSSFKQYATTQKIYITI